MLVMAVVAELITPIPNHVEYVLTAVSH